ncbi:hypothetical protein PSA5_20495 [Pseudomonas syringae pv. actinidiae]|nr:hypothetical protein PSA5_20495 [Pseudomonas syringae pv. actinidiae]
MHTSFRTLAAALLMGGSAMVMAANDGQSRVNELLSSAPEYRTTWAKVVKKEERLPEWVLNLSGASEQQMTATSEGGDKYLVGPLCETADTCKSKRLIVAFSSTRKTLTPCWLKYLQACLRISRQPVTRLIAIWVSLTRVCKSS